jgi:nickel-dependent lactate racemase
MNDEEITAMFGPVPHSLFRAHHWRRDCRRAGTIPADFMESVSEGAVVYDLEVLFNSILFERDYGCILSISQVVPHEVAGMSGFTKNIVVGLGGAENIHKTHFLGAAYGMEKIMGRSGTPVRRVLDHVIATFCKDLPIVHVITVVGRDAKQDLKVRGLFIGDDDECYRRAAQLSQSVNIHLFDNPIRKAVVYLDPVEYKSTWLGNKSIYRTRMAIADGGEILILAPGVKRFGEDQEIDNLIRTYGYRGTPATMAAFRTGKELENNLSAAAHLIHGSSEGRFSITYCVGKIGREDMESVGFGYAPVNDMIKRYDPENLSEGYNRMPDGEEIYFISSPGTGLWASRGHFSS